jgi:uncharacterized protein (DUF1330 family)
MSETYVDPEKARFSQFKDLPRDQPVHMLNLVRLNDVAVYEDGTETTGKEAYAAYGRESGPVFRSLGGRIVWSAEFELTLIGPADEAWDIVFVAEYPSGEAFISMLRDPVYREAVRHRQAAVKTSRLIRLKPKPAGAGFGE